LILLINPGRKNFPVSPGGQTWMPPLWMITIAALTPSDREVKIYDELTAGPIKPEAIPDDLLLVGIGGLTTSRPRSQELASLIRKKKIPVVAGGIDITGQYRDGERKELLATYSAIVVGRLTENLWQRVIADCQKNQVEGNVYQAEKSEEWEWVLPKYNLLRPKNYLFPTIRISEGCPHNCPWCVVNLITERKVHCKPGEIIRQELGLLPPSSILMVSDDSFGANEAHTNEIALPELRRSQRKWATEITAQKFLKLAEQMAKAGCLAVYLGIESINKKASAKCLEREKVEEAIKLARELKIIVAGSFILDITGEETEESVKETVNWANNWLELAQFSLTVPVPGSRLRQSLLRRKSRREILDFDPEHYDGSKPIISHPHISPQNLLLALKQAYQNFYSRWQILRKFKHPFLWPRIIDLTKVYFQIRTSIKNWNWQ